MATSNSKQNLSETVSAAPPAQNVLHPSASVGGGSFFSHIIATFPFGIRCNGCIFNGASFLIFVGPGVSSPSAAPHLLSAANHLEIPSSNNPNLLSPDILNQRRGNFIAIDQTAYVFDCVCVGKGKNLESKANFLRRCKWGFREKCA